MYINSKLDQSDRLKNSDRKFGAAEYYYPIWISDTRGKEYFALFTEREVEVAKQRGEKNPEDVMPPKPLYRQALEKVLAVFGL